VQIHIQQISNNLINGQASKSPRGVKSLLPPPLLLLPQLMQPAEPVQVSEPPYIIKSLLPPPLLQSAEPIQTSHAAGRKTAKLFLALPYEERLDLIRAARTSAGLVTGSLDFDCRTAQASVHVDKLMILQHIVDNYIAVKREAALATVLESNASEETGRFPEDSSLQLIRPSVSAEALASVDMAAMREEAYDNFNAHVRTLLRRSLVSFSHAVLHNDASSSRQYTNQIRDRNRPDGKPNDLGQHASTAIASAAHGPVVRTASPLSQGVLPSSAPGRPKLRKWMPGRRVRPAPA